MALDVLSASLGYSCSSLEEGASAHGSWRAGGTAGGLSPAHGSGDAAAACVRLSLAVSDGSDGRRGGRPAVRGEKCVTLRAPQGIAGGEWEVGVARHPGQTEKVRPCPCRWLHQGGPLPRAVSASSPEACLLFQGLARPTFRDPRIIRSALVTGVPALTVGPTASPVWESFWICTHSQCGQGDEPLASLGLHLRAPAVYLRAGGVTGELGTLSAICWHSNNTR